MVDVIVSFVVGVAVGAVVVRCFFPKKIVEVKTIEKIVEVPVKSKKAKKEE